MFRGSYYDEEICPVCHGRGIIKTPDGKRWQVCPKCHGKGKIRKPDKFYTWAR